MVPDGFTELASRPRGGRVFAQTMRAGLGDCAASGRIRLDALARWLQDIAYADVEDAGLAHTAVWVVRRTALHLTRFPRFGERLTVTTFCSGLGRMWAERRTTLSREGQPEPDVETVALWVHLDPATRRPTPFTDEEATAYGDAAAARRISARLRHPRPAEASRQARWSFRASECDIAGHINNAAYWTPVEEELLARRDQPERIDIEMEFRTPSQPGEKRILAAGERRWILDDGGEIHASVVSRALA